MAVITSPFTGTTITATNIGQVMGLLYQDLNAFADQMDGAGITLRYPEFERDYGKFGALLKSTRFTPPESYAPTPQTQQICGPYYRDADTLIFGKWTEKHYPWEVRPVELTKVVRGEEEYSAVLARIIEALSEGYRRDTNTAIDDTFLRLPGNTRAGVGNPLLEISENEAGQFVPAATSALYAAQNPRYEIMRGETGVLPGFATVYTRVLQIYYDMMRESDKYARTSGVVGAKREDLAIYFPSNYLATADIAYLRTVNNPAGVEQLPEIRRYWAERDTATTGGGAGDTARIFPIFLIDKRVINHVTRYRAFEENHIGCRFSDQLDLHIEDGVFVNQLYNAYALIVTDSDNVVEG